MITFLLAYIAGTILNAFAGVLALINTFVLPNQINTAMAYFLKSVNILNGVFPVAVLLNAVGYILTAIVMKYSIQILLWGISFIPGIQYKEIPTLSTTANTSEDSKGKTRTSYSISKGSRKIRRW